MSDNDQKPEAPARQGLHGAVKFILLFPVGFFGGIGGLMLVGWSLDALGFASKNMPWFTVFSVGAAVSFVLALVVGPAMRKWGLSGFLLGAAIPFACLALIDGICGGGW